jgi:hypothetical protein
MRRCRLQYDTVKGRYSECAGGHVRPKYIYRIGAYYGGMRTGAANDTCEDKHGERTQNGVEVYTFDNNSTTSN